MYLGLALTFLIILYIKNENLINSKSDILLFLLILLLLIYIGARTALFSVFVIIAIAIYTKDNANIFIKITISAFAILLLMTAGYKNIPRVKNDLISLQKVYSSIVTDNNEDLVNNSWSNMYKRYLVLDYSIKEIKNHFVFGIGLGNVTHKISDQILKDGYKYFQPMNTHNQYLHFLLGLGIFAFLYFIFILFQFKVYNPEWGYFLLFFILIMLTESILVRIKGISIFFMFYLIFSSHKNH
jgi:O-antigen ligase